MKNPNDKKEIDEKIMNNEQQRLYQYIEEQKIKLDEMKELIRNEKKLLNEAIVERREHFYNIYNIIQNSGIDEKIQLDTDNFFVKKLLIRNIKPFFVKEYNENQTKLSSPQSSMNMDPLSQQRIQKSMNRTILSTAITAQQLPGDQFSNYLHRFQ